MVIFPKFAATLLIAWCCSSGLVMAETTTQTTETDQAAESLESLRSLNQSFLSLYGLQMPLIEAELPLVVVIRSESISAIESDKTTTYTLASRIEEIKSALHATLGFQGLLTVAATKPVSSLDDPIWLKVAQFDADLAVLEGLVVAANAKEVTRSATLAALHELRVATTTALADKRVTKQQVSEALRASRPHVMQAVTEIGDVSLEQMISVLRAIEQKVPADVWNKAVIMVPGPAAARMDNLAVLAAIKVLGEDELGRRIFYSENVFDDNGMVSVVKSLMKDKQFSEMMFDNPYRMWRDLFSDVSLQHIDHNYFTPLAQQP